MKKKNLALTKRVVSFITAACLSLSSTIMVLPASAYTSETAPTSATLNGDCMISGCTGKYAWAEDESGNHVLKCDATGEGATQHTATGDGTSHVAGQGGESCTLCAAMPDVTITSLSEEGVTIKVTCGDDVEVTNGKKIASGSTLTLSIEGENANNYDVTWSITGGAENGNATETTTGDTTIVSNVVSDITINATLTEKSGGNEPEGETKYTVTFTGTFEHGSYTVKNGENDLHTGDEVVANTEITIVPAPVTGYEVDTVKVNGTTVSAENGAYTYTVTANIASIDVTFKLAEYKVNYSPTDTVDNGFTVKKGDNDVTSETRVTVEDTLTLEATANPGYTFKQWTITNATVQDSAELTASFITIKPDGNGDVSISAEFERIMCTVTYSAPSVGDENYHGTFTVTKEDNSLVASGFTVAHTTRIIINPEPAEGYEVDTVTVSDSNSREIYPNDDGVYYCAVSANITSITVTFKEQQTNPTTYNITIPTHTGGEIKTVVGEISAVEGESVSFKVTADEDYQLKADSVKVYKTGDTNTEVTDVTLGENGQYTFTMPGYDVTITAEFEVKAPETYTVTTNISGVDEADKDSVTVTVKSGENGETEIPGAGVAKDTKITVTPNGGDKYTVKSVTYQVETAEAQTVTATDGKYTFDMPEGNVTITVTFEKVAEKYTVSVDNGVTNGTIAATNDSSFADVAENTTVKFTVTPAQGYTLKTGTVKVMNGEEEVAVTPTYKEEGNQYSGVDYYSFTMPAANVTVTATFIPKVSAVKNADGSYTITSTENGGMGEGYNDIAVTINDLLNSRVLLSDVQSFSFDYAFDTEANENASGNGAIGVNCKTTNWTSEQWSGTSGTATVAVNGNTNATELLIQIYHMNPNSTLTISNIKANTTEYTITVAEPQNGTVEAPAKAQYGEEVTLKVKPAANYVLKSLTLKISDEDPAIPVEDNKFTMPRGNVTVTAEFEAIASVFTVKIDDKTSTDKLDTWADVLKYVKTNGGADKTVVITVNGEAEFTGVLPAAKEAKELTIDGQGTLKFGSRVTALKINANTIFEVKLALSSENAKKVNVTVPAGKMFVLQSVDYIDIFGKISGTKTSALGTISKVTADQISTFLVVDTGNSGSIIVNGNVSGVSEFNGDITLVNNLTGTKATTAAIDGVSNTSSIKLVANEKGVLPKLTVADVQAPDKENEKSAVITVVNAAGEEVDLTSGTIVAYTKGNNIEENITIGNKSGANELKAFYYSKTKAVKAEIATAMTVKKGEETTGKDYPNLELALASMTENADYTLTLNADATVANLVMPKNITGLTINTGVGTGAKLVITGTKLNATKNLTLDLPVQVEKGKTNKTGKIDITVAKGMTLNFDTNFSGEVINRITGTNTSTLKAILLSASQISTFKDIEATALRVDGNVSNVTNFCGILYVRGAKSKINITNVLGDSEIALLKDEKGAIPALTVSDVVGISTATDEDAKNGKLTIGVMDISLTNGELTEDAVVSLTSGTTVATIKAVAKGTPAEDVVKKISIVNEDTNNNALTANYYSKTKTVKAEYNGAISVYYGEVKEDSVAVELPNLDKVLEEIAKQTTAQDVTLEINSDITAAANFALPKKNVSSITFTGDGSITFLGTKLAIPYDTKLDVDVIANNKAKALDLTVSSTKTKPVELTITVATLTLEGTTINSYFGKVTGNVGATLTVDNGGSFVSFKGISKFDTVTGNIKVTGNVANVGVFSGVLEVHGAKTTVGIGEIKDFVANNETNESYIELYEESNTLPKVTIASIADKSGLRLGVFAGNKRINLESGRTVLYTKDNKFADADKIVIENNWGEEFPTMTASYDAKTKTIKAVDALAVSLFEYDAEKDVFVAVKEGEGDNEKAVTRKSLEEIVAYIDGLKNSEAIYEIDINSSIEVAKLALPTKAERVIIAGDDDVVINIGKTASITAPTDIELDNVIFKTTAKTLTLNAKKSVFVIDDTTIDVFKGTKGNKRLNEEHFMEVLSYSGDIADPDYYDVSGFDTLYVGAEKESNLEDGTNNNYGMVYINTTLDVTKLVLAEDSELFVRGTLKKGQFAEFKSEKDAVINYAEMGKTTLKFTGKNADAFKVDSTTGLKIDAVYGTKLLTTKAIKDLSIFKDKNFNYATASEGAIKPNFTQVGNDIVYLRESFALSSTKGDKTDDLGMFSRWDDVVAKIAALNDKEAAYTITLRERIDSASAIKFPKAGTYKSLTVSGYRTETIEGTKMEYSSSMCFTGSLALTGNTTFEWVNLDSVKFVKGDYKPANYSISANAYDVVFDKCIVQNATVTAKNLTVKDCMFDADKITVRETLTTNLSGEDNKYIGGFKGVQTKNWVLESDTDLLLGFKSTVKVTNELSVAKNASGAYKLKVTAYDKNVNIAKTFAKNYSLGTVKKGYELVELENDGYMLKTEARSGKLTVVPKEGWVVKNNKVTLYLNETSDKDKIGTGYLPIDSLLAEGKTRADVIGFVCNVSFKNSNATNGCIGVNNSVVDASNQWGTWTSAEWNKDSSKVTMNLDGIHSSQKDIQFQIWWIDGANEIEFSDCALVYKSVE